MSVSTFFSIIIRCISVKKQLIIVGLIKSSMNFNYEIIIVDDHSKNKPNYLRKKNIID